MSEMSQFVNMSFWVGMVIIEIPQPIKIVF
jgi:hypothetical protein